MTAGMDEGIASETVSASRSRSAAAADEPAGNAGASCCAPFFSFLPRPDLALLLLALFWTLGAKTLAVMQQAPVEVMLSLVQAVLPDLVFFVIVSGLFTLAYLLPCRRAVGRVTLLVAGVILGWSVLNGIWLITTGVQLQPGVLLVLLRTSSDMWSLATGYLFREPLYLFLVVGTLLIAGVWFSFRLVRPIVPAHSPRQLLLRGGAHLCLLIVFAVALNISHRPGRIAYSGQIIGFSSHWYAIVNLVTEMGYGDISGEARLLPRAGERTLTLPDAPTHELPNVFVIMLESLPYRETSSGMPERDLTPALAKFAAEGAEFRRAYMPIAQTTKAFWSAFTGMYPEVQPGYAESIIADETYESLPTILRRLGYRSGFFQMSPGTFESLPAFFHNTGFDLAWFFENLRRSETKVTMLSGDDFAMLDTMFGWVDAQDGPFFLTTITSITHDPFLVPQWYRPLDQQPADRYERFLLSIEFQDLWLAEVLDRLETRGLAENTIVVVLGDHGESFRPEARRGRWGIFEELVRVPMAMRWPGVIEPGQVIDELAAAIDITPTVLQLMGFGISEAEFDGLNMLGGLPSDRRVYLSAWHRNSPIGFVEQHRKVVYWPSTDVMFDYDLVRDPEETDPRTIVGSERDTLLADIFAWQQGTYFDIPPRRFREGLFFGHWRVFSTGRTGRSFFVDEPDEQKAAASD